MRHSLQHTHYTHTRRVDAATPYHWYLTYSDESIHLSDSLFCSGKEAIAAKLEWARSMNVPAFRITLQRAQ